MKLPNEVIVGPLTYELSLVPSPLLGNFEDSPEIIVGNHCFLTGRIAVLETLSPTFMVETLWHEILHAVIRQRNIELSETEIDALAHGLMDLLKSNPWLANFEPDRPAFIGTSSDPLSGLLASFVSSMTESNQAQ